jgi:hypothetical protein
VQVFAPLTVGSVFTIMSVDPHWSYSRLAAAEVSCSPYGSYPRKALKGAL